MRKRDITLLCLALILLFVGLQVYFIPEIHEQRQKTQSEQIVESFFREHLPLETEQDLATVNESSEKQGKDLPYAELLQAMREYNAQIYYNGQAGLSDPWAYTSEVFDLSAYGLDSEMIGVLTIPKMALQEPVYLGATAAHLNKGVAQLSISSMPIGGSDTNCVIAGHRGWDGALFFRHIEVLETGDEVLLTNLWETLHYRVCEIKIIQPYQAEQILIQPGRDLLTLLTCHPYGSGGQYRYAVFCERVPEEGSDLIAGRS